MTAPVVWIADAGEAHPAPGGDASAKSSAAASPEAQRALDAWAKARGVELTFPAGEAGEPEQAAPPLAQDWTAADKVEKGLARVRDALAGLEIDRVERELARAEAVLREHPELPQAAQLRAEVERAWSVRWLRGGDEERAKRAWQRAAGLDGGRAPGLGEKAFEGAPTVAATIRLADAGGARGQALRLDGVLVASSGAVERVEGEHALAIVDAAGRATWAEWVTLGKGTAVLLTAPPAAACSSADLKRARLGKSGTAVDAGGVRCPAWVAAVSVTAAVRVATCEADACGPLVEWRSIDAGTPGWTFEPGATAPAAEARFRWPAWGTWAVVGVGVAGAAVGIAAAAGAFRSSPGAETQFVNGGVVVHSF